MHSHRKKLVFFVFIIASLMFTSANLWAVSLSPEVVERLRNEGRLQQWIDRAHAAREQGVWQPNPNPPALRSMKGALMPQVDTVRAIVLLVDFDDNVSTRTPPEFEQLLFSKGFIVPTGSMRDFYWENSYQTFEFLGDVAGWYRMPQDYTYYTDGQNGFGSYPNNAKKLVEDAVDAADPDVDYSLYDSDGNNYVDALFVVHAGPGAEATGNDWHIWSHRSSINPRYRDGVWIEDYSMEPEVRGGGALVDMGVFSHEFGHMLGLPDLYDGDYTSEGLGEWTLMAGGSWNNNGHTPAHFDGWCKKTLGWTNVVWVDSNLTNAEILQAETSPVSYRLWTSGYPSNEYFLVENRQQTGFDSYIPSDGLLIYHVEHGGSNNQEWCPSYGYPADPHYKVALMQADGRWQLEGCGGFGMNSGDQGDPFPGTFGKRTFNDTTEVNSLRYDGNSSEVAVWNISDSDSVMYADFDVNWSRPGLLLDNLTFDDIMGGDGDGRPEAGETVRLLFTISNLWLPLDGTIVTGSVDTAGIIFTDDQSDIGYIGTGGSANNNSDVMEFEVDTLFPGRPTTFTLHVEGNSGSYAVDLEKLVAVGKPPFLIVDDDQSGLSTDYLSYYTDALDSTANIYDVWDTEAKGDPDFSFIGYRHLIWFTGDHKTSMFSQAQVESLMSFLDHGGGLFLTSQDAGEVLYNSGNSWDSLFLKDYLHVESVKSCSRLLIAEGPGDEVGEDLWIWPGSTPGANNQNSKEALFPDSDADTVLLYANSGFTPTDSLAGIKYLGDNYKVVFFGFGFEGINQSGIYMHGHYVTKPHVVMQAVVDWLNAPWPAIDVMLPNGGETWYMGSAADIEWQSISFEDDVKIEYSTNAGVDWSSVVDYTTNDGFYSWPVPDTLTPSDSCLVRISDAADGSPADTSDDYFSIVSYVAGDANGDLEVNVGDIVYLVTYLYKGGPAPSPLEAGDANCDDIIDVGDIVYLVSYLYKGGPPPGC
ncbi:MAG: M6 family metalloprotease domain-containing protein [Candidatus Zixiibacteriota bacterium]|nr:MAG: M6 family metalloprotease domain-containing protein [candidate division Zixibacteria bacterium]